MEKRLKLRVGATKTIGDYVLIDAIKEYLVCPVRDLSLVVDNTKHLLQISFLYRSVIANEDSIGTFTVDGITEPHPFHVVYTRDTNAKRYAEQFLANQTEHLQTACQER